MENMERVSWRIYKGWCRRQKVYWRLNNTECILENVQYNGECILESEYWSVYTGDVYSVEGILEKCKLKNV